MKCIERSAYGRAIGYKPGIREVLKQEAVRFAVNGLGANDLFKKRFMMLLPKFSLEYGGYESDLYNVDLSREIRIGDHVRVVRGLLSDGEGSVIMVNRNNRCAKIRISLCGRTWLAWMDYECFDLIGYIGNLEKQ
jgi:transcription antitermination factor NusG